MVAARGFYPHYINLSRFNGVPVGQQYYYFALKGTAMPPLATARLYDLEGFPYPIYGDPGDWLYIEYGTPVAVKWADGYMWLRGEDDGMTITFKKPVESALSGPTQVGRVIFTKDDVHSLQIDGTTITDYSQVGEIGYRAVADDFVPTDFSNKSIAVSFGSITATIATIAYPVESANSRINSCNPKLYTQSSISGLLGRTFEVTTSLVGTDDYAGGDAFEGEFYDSDAGVICYYAGGVLCVLGMGKYSTSIADGESPCTETGRRVYRSASPFLDYLKRNSNNAIYGSGATIGFFQSMRQWGSPFGDDFNYWTPPNDSFFLPITQRYFDVFSDNGVLETKQLNSIFFAGSGAQLYAMAGWGRNVGCGSMTLTVR
jgi:hypothetical protein